MNKIFFLRNQLNRTMKQDDSSDSRKNINYVNNLLVNKIFIIY